MTKNAVNHLIELNIRELTFIKLISLVVDFVFHSHHMTYLILFD